MTLDDAISQIRASVDLMNARYGKTVFNEWAVLAFHEKTGRVLAYTGPRKDDFMKNFSSDLGGLSSELTDDKYSTGDFEFSRHGVGTGFEAFMVLAPGIYLICNNTHASMEDIAKDQRWLVAQVPFVELSDKIRGNPVA